MILEAVIFLLVLYILTVYFTEKRPTNYPPGPIGVPILGYLPFLAPDSHIKVGKLGKKYGNIFSMKLGNFWFVVLNDLEVIKSALKMDEFTGRPNYLLGMAVVKKGISYNEGKEWLEQRRFSLKTLRDFGFGKKSMENSIQEEVQELVSYFSTQTGKPISVKGMLSVSILNALWAIVAGEKFSLDDPKPRKIYQICKQGFLEPEIQGPLYFLPWMAKLAPVYTGYAGIVKAKHDIQELLLEVIDQHKKTYSPDFCRDYIDVYIKKCFEVEAANDKKSSFYGSNGVENFVDSLISLFIAGSDTLTNTMGFAILYLTKQQNALRNLQKEIDKVIGHDRCATSADRPKMPYMEATMAEVLRMSSIVAGSLLHSVTEDTTFKGYFFPKRTIVMPNLYQVHHDTFYWGDPDNFRPERFLNTDGSYRKDEAVIPFSTGKRVCLAENLAQLEFFLFLTGIVQNFDFIEDQQNNPLPSFIPKSAFVLAPNPYKVVLKSRQNS